MQDFFTFFFLSCVFFVTLQKVLDYVMISKAEIQRVRSLSQKKFRDELGLFVGEGQKLVSDMLSSFPCNCIYVSSDAEFPSFNGRIEHISQSELERISNLRSPQGVVGVFETRYGDLSSVSPDKELTLCLDGIQDPGNMGTIIRTADWFGIRHVVCSNDCVDVFNPKVVQATMGALARVSVCYTNLTEWIKNLKDNTPIYGTLLDGKNIYEQELSDCGVLIMGNEGNGISEEVRKLITAPLYFPNFPIGVPTSESLNVGVATALFCSEFRRRQAQNPKAKG